MTFRCAVAARERGDGLAGTASTVAGFLAVEHPGPWGEDAFRDARLPSGLGARLVAEARRARVRPLLLRRGRHQADPMGVQAIISTGGELSAGLLTGPQDAVAVLHGAPLERRAEPVFLICTHGRHDACCAEQGRPVAAALTAAHEDAWECSHIGGDRFAANLVVLHPGLLGGLYYGGLDADSGLRVAAAHRAGHLDLDHLRGRTSLSMPAQAAEIALRRHLGETRLDAVTPLQSSRGGARTRAVFAVDGDHWAVEVDTVAGDSALLTCGARRENPVPEHRIVSITPLAS